jgi:two-component system NtrC family sensor kinase
VVIPPVWQQPWFLVVVAFMVGAIALQTGRVVRRGRRLQKANEALSAANNDLADLNQQLQASNQHLRETREQLVIQEKMASLGNLVAGLTHEMNTPLGALNSAVDVLRRCADRIAQIVSGSRTGQEIGEDAGYRKAMTLLGDSSQTALTVAERFSRIVESLKNFVRLDESDLQRVDVHEGLESILLLRGSDFGDGIDVIRAYGDIPLVTCYPGELNQVFMNILSNAIEAIDDKGEIRIETMSDGRDVYIAISDSGCGISPEHLDRIFDPGFTTRGVGVGTGLGLATSYRIVDKHEGTIRVQSEVGEGSTFTVRIPIRLV